MDEEVTVSYGAHNNDFLLVECKSHYLAPVDADFDLDGFSYADNDHDSIKLDSILLPKLSEDQKSLLQNIGYLGYDILESPLV